MCERQESKLKESYVDFGSYEEFRRNLEEHEIETYTGYIVKHQVKDFQSKTELKDILSSNNRIFLSSDDTKKSYHQIIE